MPSRFDNMFRDRGVPQLMYWLGDPGDPTERGTRFRYVHPDNTTVDFVGIAQNRITTEEEGAVGGVARVIRMKVAITMEQYGRFGGIAASSIRGRVHESDGTKDGTKWAVEDVDETPSLATMTLYRYSNTERTRTGYRQTT